MADDLAFDFGDKGDARVAGVAEGIDEIGFGILSECELVDVMNRGDVGGRFGADERHLFARFGLTNA